MSRIKQIFLIAFLFALMINNSTLGVKQTQILLSETTGYQLGFPRSIYNMGLRYAKGDGVKENEQEAIKCFESVKDSVPEANYQLGKRYDSGISIEKRLLAPNNIKAAEHYSKAAKEGVIPAQVNLGLLYAAGKLGTTERNFVKARKWFTYAAQQGNAKAQYCLGLLWWRGQGGMQDQGEGLKWLKKAASQGLIEANDYLQGATNEINTKFEGKIPIILRFAEWCDNITECDQLSFTRKNVQEIKKYINESKSITRDALFLWGYIIYKIARTKEDYIRAAEWFKKASDQEQSQAQYMLSEMYYFGEGLNKSEKDVLIWLTKAARNDNPIAQHNLGCLYLEGGGTEAPDFKQSFYWFKRSARQGNRAAQYNIGRAYAKGWGVKEDHDIASQWYEKSANQGFALAQRGLGIGDLYLNEFDSDQLLEDLNPIIEQIQSNKGPIIFFMDEDKYKSKERITRRLHQAAEQGLAEAQCDLADRYAIGDIHSNVPNFIYSAEWYIKAARQDHLRAQRCLGRIYFSGNGVLKNKSKALLFLSKAAKGDDNEAQEDLAFYENRKTELVEDNGEVLIYILKQQQLDFLSLFPFFSDNDPSRIFKVRELKNKLINSIIQIIEENKGKATSSVVRKLSKEAAESSIEAQIAFGIIYALGLGIGKDTQKAYEWILEAAQRGHPKAQKILGTTYENSRLVSKDDHNELVKYFTIPDYKTKDQIDTMLSMAHTWVHMFHADLGDLYAETKIIRPLLCGDKEVFSWLYASSARGNIKALYRLGRMHEYGWGTSKDERAAFDCFMKGARDYRYPPAQKAVAEMYREGRGGAEQSNFLSVKWYSRAGKQGDAGASAAIKDIADSENYASALYALGRAHEEGWGIARDEDEALLQYEQSALQEYFKGQCKVAVKQLEGKAPFKEELAPLELLTLLSGEEARRNYLKFVGKKFDVKERKKLRKLQQEGLPEERLPEGGYYKAQHKLAELYETGQVLPPNTIRDIMASYGEAIRLYELAIHSNKPVAMAPLERVRFSLEKLNKLSEEERVRADHPEFSQFLKARVGEEKKLGTEFLYHLAFLFNQANNFNKEVKKKLRKMVGSLMLLPEESKQTQGIMHMLTTLLQSKEFKEGQLHALPGDSDAYRLKELSAIEDGIKFIQRPWSLIPLPSTLPSSLSVSRAILHDPRIEMFNSYFRQAENAYDPDLFKRSVDKVLNLFDRLRKEGFIKDESLYSEDDGDYGTRETLEKLLTHNHKPDNRFGHRLIRIADIVYNQFKKDSSLVASQLTQWAKRGLNCLTASEEEMNKFYIEYITNTKNDSGALAKEDRTLEMQVALLLAKLRYRLLDEIVERVDEKKDKEANEQRIHAVKHLEKKARWALGLLGDAENYTDISEEELVESKYKKMTSEDIVEEVLKTYTSDFIAHYIAQQINEGAINYEKIIRRLRFQCIRERVAPYGQLDESLFKDEDYLLDHCTREEFTRYPFLLDMVGKSNTSKGVPDWDALKGQSYERAHQQVETEFYDENYQFTPKATKALLKGMGYLEGE